MTGTLRDNQRSKTYDLGSSLRSDGTRMFTLEECREIIHKVCDVYGIRYPRLKDGRRNRNASANAAQITLPRWARQLPTISHELAHCILDARWRYIQYAPHGPEFSRLYMEIYCRLSGKTFASVNKLAKEHNIKVAPATRIPKTVLQRRLVIK